MSGDDLARLIYLAGSHPDEFVRCACAARALEVRGATVTAAAVARVAKLDDRELAGDVADGLTERKTDDDYPHAARIRVLAGVTEGMLDLGPWGLHRTPPRA